MTVVLSGHVLACDLSVVTEACDGLPWGACPNTRGVRYVDGIPLCPEHRAAEEDEQ